MKETKIFIVKTTVRDAKKILRLSKKSNAVGMPIAEPNKTVPKPH